MKRSLLVIALLVSACGGTTTTTKPAKELGAALFRDSHLSSASSNAFSCATCHAPTAADEGTRRYPGFPLEDSAQRPSWWDGYELQYVDAVNVCYEFFMRAPTDQAIVEGDPDGDALYEYLASLSPTAGVPAQPFTVVKNIQPIPAGDAVSGADLYAAACETCHGAKGSGHGKLGGSTTVLGDALWSSYDTTFPGIDHKLVVTEKVRHGSFFGVGGNMPFFASERLSDSELADILAYLDP